MACGLHSCYGTHIVHIHTHNPTGVLFTHTSRPGHVSRLDWHLQCRQGSNNREFRTTDAARARLYKILRPHLSGGWNSFFKQNITDIVFLLRTTSEHQSELPHPRSSFTDCQIHSAGSTRTKDCRTQRRRRRQATEQHSNNSATPTRQWPNPTLDRRARRRLRPQPHRRRRRCTIRNPADRTTAPPCCPLPNRSRRRDPSRSTRTPRHKARETTTLRSPSAHKLSTLNGSKSPARAPTT